MHLHYSGVRLADMVGATVSVIGFAFYLQPIAMPMLREMPPGEVGYKILSFCMRVTIMGATQDQCRHGDIVSLVLHARTNVQLVYCG